MKRKNLKKPMISALEQRILFDGAAVATAVDVLDNSSFTPTNDSTTTNDMTNNNAENSVHEAQAVQGFEKSRKEVAFVDVTVKDYQTLVDGVGEGVETYLVSSLDEIKSILENETNIDAIHILSHGETGEITVGNDVLNKDTLQNFDAVLQSMKTSLTENGDILLYGCNVANDGSGEEFITELATITEADVAASDDLTGSSALGGDWVLEVNTGSIEASSLEIMNYEKILSVPNDITTFGSSVYYSPPSVADTSGYTVSDIVSSGWDFTVYSNNNQSDALINVDQLTGQTNLAYGASYFGYTKIMGIELSSNTYKVFDLQSVDIIMDQANGTGDNTSILMQLIGYKNGIAVSGATLIKSVTNASGGGLLVTFDVSSNSNFIGIDSFKVTPTGSDYTYAIGVDNIRALNFRDPSDTTAPIFDITPSTSNITATTLDLSASLDEAGKIYYVVVPDGATAPSVAQIKAGQDSSGSTALKSGNSDVTTIPFTRTYNITGLNANTAYDIYVVGQDDEGTPNVMATATKVDVTTAIGNSTPDVITMGNGHIVLQPEAYTSDSKAIFEQADGKILVVGSSQPDSSTKNIFVQSLNSDGTVDTSFGGGDGVATISNPTGRNLNIYGATKQSDGKIIVSGASYDGSYTNVDFALLRINTDGSLDTTFGTNGYTITDMGSASDFGTSVAIDSNGNIIVGGQHYVSASVQDFAVARYTSSGVLDTSFSSDGKAYVSASGFESTNFTSLTIQSDNKILITGYASNSGSFSQFALARLNTDGTLDSTFGTNGVVTTDMGSKNDQALSVSVGTDGKIVVAGLAYNDNPGGGWDVALARYTSLGVLDTTFSGDGKLITQISGVDASKAEGVQVLSDGKIIVRGLAENFSTADNDFLVIKYNADGTLDTTFSSDGISTTNFGFYSDIATTMTIQSDGKILVGGLSGNSDLSNTKTAIVRLNTDGTQDSTFGKLTYTLGDNPLVLNAQVLDNELSDVPDFTNDNYNGAVLTLSRQDGANSNDVFSASGTLDSISAVSGNIIVGGTTVGTYTNNAGSLIITFNSSSTSINVSQVMEQIAYKNIGTNSETVNLLWSFNDGNTGSQGSDGAKIGTAISTVYIVNSGPTVSVATGSYTDTIANDTFANITGSISATASSGSILGYGINSGTTGGSTTIGSVTYDVSKAGTYGTLYVKSSDGSYIYVPTSDSVINATTSTVTDSFTIEATDGAGTKGNTLTISINGVNDSPVLSAPTEGSYTDTSATDTFTNTTGTLSASDRDTGTTLTYGISTGTTSGTDVIGGITYDVSKVGTYGTLYVKSTDGSYVYVPNASAINALISDASDTFTVSSSDGSLNDTQTLTINITGANDAPTAQNKTITIDEDTITVLNVSDFGFADVDTGSALSSVEITSLASHGTLEYFNVSSWIAVTSNQKIAVTDITNGKLRFNPSLNENGTSYATFNFTVNDGTVDSTAKTITYNVTAVNDAPTLTNAISDQNASVSNIFNFTIPSNSFTDVDTSDTLTYTAKLVDSNGDLVSSGTLPSWLSFDANTKTFSGTPTNSDTGIIYIKVTASDNGSLNVSDIFTITTNSGPTVSVATGSYTDTVANDTFANITGSISATASSGSILGYGINSGTTGGSTTIGSVTYDVSKAGTYGTLYVKSSDGSYIYVPTSDSVINATTSTVTDSFTIEATDGAGTKGNTLTISINGVNDSPVLSAPTEGSYTDTSATDTFTNTTGTLSASDRDTGTTLTYGISTGTTSGTDVIGGITYDVSKVGTYGTLYVKSTDGSYVYVPNASAINALISDASDTFTVSSSDGSLNDTQTLTINITGANDAPTAQNKTITIDEDTITVLNVSDFGFADVDTGSALSSVEITSLASHGTLEYFNVSSWIAVTSNQKIAVTDITNGKLRFNPSLNENGTSYATFNFTVNDGTVDSTAKTITYNVTAVNDAPTLTNAISDQNASVSNIFNFTIPSNSFTDVDTSDTLTYTAKLVDSNGDLVSSGTLPSWLSFDANTKTFSGTPTNSDTGIIYIKVTASDNGSLNVSDIFTITTNSGPTVSVATGSYTDTVANDTFANITGSISATASSGSILGYGINSGTTGGSTTIGSVTYDVSKAGTYGTLYVKSSDGSYIYVPTSDSVINATTSTVTDSFTIEATDGAGTKGNTLTITINGVNDSPSISNEIINQTATQNSIFNFTIPTNSFTDVDTSDTLTYTAKLVDSNGDLVSSGTLPSWLSFDANTKTFSGTPTNSDTGIIYIKVTASDNGSLNVSDIFTITVENVNDNPIGNVIISGSPIQGEILTVSNTLTDEDGLGEITYQWYANNEIIDGATNSTYTLTQNEVNKVITVKATYIDGFGTLESVISNVTNQILNINDAPTVLTDNLDVNLAFGDSYTKDISELFKDIDFDNIFTFEATDLPLGLTLNPSTGIISGKVNESGEFIVTIKATDNGNPALSVSRTYKIFVLAPVQIENSQPPVSEPLNNTPSNVFSDITLSTFLDTISLGTINNNLGTNITDNIGIGYLNNTPPTLQINDTFNPSQNIPIIKDNGKYIETSATLNVNLNGQVSFDKTIQGSFSIVGITIEDLKIDNNKLDIKIVDTANVQNYIVTQFDGSALPAGLYFNSSTGSISGTIPDNLNELNITIKAINLDGTTRVLNLKLDLKELKQKMQAEVNEKFIGLKEQIAFENQKLDGYGSYLTKLFA